MQAIARVNRVFKDKECGLIVDYVGIASALKEAMNDYTARDRKNYGDTDVAKVAYPKFQEKLSVCRDLFYGYDYSDFIHGSNLAVLVNRLVNQGEGKKISLPEMNARINNLLKASIHSDGVINLFQDANSDFSLFDPNFFPNCNNKLNTRRTFMQ